MNSLLDQLGLTEEEIQQALRQPQPIGLPNNRMQMAQPYNPSLSERVSQGIGNALHDSGIVSDRYGANRIGKNAGSLLEMLPGTGDIAAADDFGRAAAQGDMLGMSMGALSAIPVVGKAAKKVADKVEAYIPPPENAQRTQIATTTNTYKKARDMLGKGKTLDFGAGLGKGASEIGADTYEPFAKGWNPNFTNSTDIPSSSYPKVTNLNVLNVVPREIRDNIVNDIGRVLKPGGTAIITTRGRDVLSAMKAGKPGPEPMSVITSRDTYQKGFTQKELKEYIESTLGDNFEVSNIKLGAAGVRVKKKE